nr:putative ribonuclease h protein [Quercus suber]
MNEAVDNIFLPHEAALILSIPLNLSICVDQVFWPLNPDGSYSVRSGYRWLLEEELKEMPSTSDLSTTKRIWKGVWSLRVLNRVKTLVWRAGLNLLPSRANLKKRKIVSDDLCRDCKLKSETILHALWSCSALSPVWTPKFSWFLEKTKTCMSMLDIIQCCQDHGDNADLFAMIISHLWTRRNKLGVGEWSPPPLGWAKVNFDGAMFKDKNLARLSGVIRNDKGLIMATFTHTIPLPTSVEMVEVLAARSALSLAKDLCLNKVQLESDSEVIVNALSKGGMDSSSFGHVVKDISLLSSAFQCLSFSHTRRLGNKLAHCLARSACNFSPSRFGWRKLLWSLFLYTLADLP